MSFLPDHATPRNQDVPASRTFDQDIEQGNSTAFAEFSALSHSLVLDNSQALTLTLPSRPDQCLTRETSRNFSASTSTTHELEVKENACFQAPPPKYSCEWMNTVRWEWLSVYRRLNLIVLAVNALLIIIFGIQKRLLHFNPEVMATAIAANVTAAVVFRQEYTVNLLFLAFGCLSPRLPLCVRRHAAKVYHFGGVHSGAGMASTFWLIFYDVSIALSCRNRSLTGVDIAFIILTSIANVLLLAVLTTSHPRFREKYHDTWELIHRFGGWSAVGIFWAFLGLFVYAEKLASDGTVSTAWLFIVSPLFWMLVVITICLILPWIRLRKVDVLAEIQSKFAIRLHFTYTNLPLCAAPRLSTSPLIEWHAFAGIPQEDGQGFSVLVSGVGDWTRKLIENPPKKLWVRGIPVRGVLHIVPIFTRVVLVGTGSGIGPILSLLYARKVDCRILWCTKDPKHSYRPDVLEHVLGADPNALIIARGKGQRDPDLGQLAYNLYVESRAEAVFIISNKDGSYKARMWLESRGVPAFTPIFDS